MTFFTSQLDGSHCIWPPRISPSDNYSIKLADEFGSRAAKLKDSSDPLIELQQYQLLPVFTWR